jgi:hypothetical protein
MCHIAPDFASLQGRAPERHVFHNSGYYLPVVRALVPPPHASTIKKSLSDLLMQLGSHVPNARTVIMSLQDV